MHISLEYTYIPVENMPNVRNMATFDTRNSNMATLRQILLGGLEQQEGNWVGKPLHFLTSFKNMNHSFKTLLIILYTLISSNHLTKIG